MHTRGRGINLCVHVLLRACAKRVVHAHGCTDLYQTFCGSSLVSYELKFQISWRSKLWLRRYLQNNTGVYWILCILHIFKVLVKFENTWNSLEFFEAQFQNVRISLENYILLQSVLTMVVCRILTYLWLCAACCVRYYLCLCIEYTSLWLSIVY